ncbi:MAG TPA: adenosine kinase [Miltoncostaeaceae bacterium]|nr:adenosine kinase [Miltoncostaeaceae bacterium]
MTHAGRNGGTGAHEDARLDVVGIGNAIVDVLTHAHEEFLEAHGLVKGAMTLVDGETSARIYAGMGPAVEVSGGSCANSMAGAAALGARVAYVGKVRDDQLGQFFAHDIRAAGVAYDVAPATEGPPTARCMVMVTPDAHRTMATYLGASTELGPEDIDRDLFRAARVTYLEGYLWDPPRAKQAMRVAMEAAVDAGRMVALSLSDSFCVERHRDEFLELLDRHLTVLFANEHEVMALVGGDDVWEAVARVQGRCPIVVVTRSDQGALVVTPDEVHEVPAAHVDRVVDTTGAGDLFAAGFLVGLTRGWPLTECARAGAAAAAEVISHFGARPEEDLNVVVGVAIREEA